MKETMFLKAGRHTGSAGSSTTGLPADFMSAARRRLIMASLVYGATFTVSTAIAMAIHWKHIAEIQFTISIFFAGLAVILSLATIAICRKASMSAAKIVKMGLLFEIAGGFLISMTTYWGVLTEKYGAEPGFGLSWLCVWIVIFPLIVPAPPGRALLASLITASMDPLVVFLSYLVNGFSPSMLSKLSMSLPVIWTMLFYPNYICVAMSYVGSRIVYGLGRDLNRARQMGSYSLEEKLGGGGMGEVWRASHRLLARPAAIKLIRPEVLHSNAGSAEIVLKRFEREAQATAGLGSPHTVELYDFGRTDDGAFYYVMELLDGLDLETLVARHGPLPPERAVHLLVQVCDSLADAHASGLVHRDIKPANIYACRKGNRHDFVKVLDFGLVKTQKEDSGATRLTQEGTTSGTPAYMPPEAILGEEGMDGRADIYALGCVACWLLTGQLVFEARTSMEMVMKHAREEPKPLSGRTERSIPPDLDRLVMDCLKKEPADRPAGAEELSARLEASGVGRWTEAMARDWWMNVGPKSTAGVREA